MSRTVRVIGRVDLASRIQSTLQAAGVKAELAAWGPAVYGGTPPTDGVDVVIATSALDPWLWRLAKVRHPARPMVAVAGRRREGVLCGALARRHGPDEYVIW